MRHRVMGRRLSRDSEHRRAMLRNLAAGLFEHGEIETTMPKAKAVQPFVERLITIAKKGGFTAQRRLAARVNDRKIHAWVADPNVPDHRKDNRHFDLPDAGEIEFNRYGEVRKAPTLLRHLVTVVAPKFTDREGGYTRIVKLGRCRLGDGSDLVLLQLVGDEDGPEVGGGISGRRRQADRRTAFAAKFKKAAPAQAQTESEPEADTATAVAEPGEAGATTVEEAQDDAEPTSTEEPGDKAGS